MKEYTGLSKVRQVSLDGMGCPKCGNYLEVVANGFFHGELFFCKKDNQVFTLLLKDITKKAGTGFIEQCTSDIAVKEVRSKITRQNYKKVIEIL